MGLFPLTEYHPTKNVFSYFPESLTSPWQCCAVLTKSGIAVYISVCLASQWCNSEARLCIRSQVHFLLEQHDHFSNYGAIDQPADSHVGAVV